MAADRWTTHHVHVRSAVEPRVSSAWILRRISIIMSDFPHWVERDVIALAGGCISLTQANLLQDTLSCLAHWIDIT